MKRNKNKMEKINKPEVAAVIIPCSEKERFFEAYHKFHLKLEVPYQIPSIENQLLAINDDDTISIIKNKNDYKIIATLHGVDEFYAYIDKKKWREFTVKLAEIASSCGNLLGYFIRLKNASKDDFAHWFVECYEKGFTPQEVIELYL